MTSAPTLLAAAFLVVSLLISAWTLAGHLRNYTRPDLQMYICRILLMVPVNALYSYCCLLVPQLSLVLLAVRDGYEAYVIYTFLNLLIAVTGGEAALVDYLELKPNMRHPWPLSRWCSSISLGRKFLRRVKQLILQFVILRPLTAWAAIGLTFFDLLGDGELAWNRGFLYIGIVNNISVTAALYGLALFYMATESRIESFKPLPKFLCVKGIVFVAYWQAFLLFVATWLGWLSGETNSNAWNAFTINHVLMCVEMVVAAAGHAVAFSSQEFSDYKSQKPLLDSLMQVLDVQDVLDDAQATFLKPARHSVEVSLRDMDRHAGAAPAGGLLDDDDDDKDEEQAAMRPLSGPVRLSGWGDD